MRAIATLFFVLLTFMGTAFSASIDEAKSVFDRYILLEHAFDPTTADLYADDALIKNKRIYPSGQVRVLTMPALQYKTLIRQAMPLAKVRGDTSSYSQITYTEEGTGVRILAMRFSNLKKYSSPLSILVAPDQSGRWLIREELSESQP
jgi:hypothetical protein